MKKSGCFVELFLGKSFEGECSEMYKEQELSALDLKGFGPQDPEGAAVKTNMGTTSGEAVLHLNYYTAHWNAGF